jgi:hypothetical protein
MRTNYAAPQVLSQATVIRDAQPFMSW